MTIPDGRWKDEAGKLIVTGVQGEGKSVTYRFTVQPTGDLFWEQNGARLAKIK